MTGLTAAVARWVRSRRQGSPDPTPRLGEVAPVLLPGPWPAGVALAKHSSEETDARTAVGDVLDRFKYGGERGLARHLAAALAEVLRAPDFAGVEAVVHVPATTERHRIEPTVDLAEALARRLGVRCFPGLVARARAMEHQKDISHLGHKAANVEGAFRIRRSSLVKGRTLLLIDDVFDSGATLEEVWRVLMAAGARTVLVATVTKTRYWQEP